ncbi:hypothetical protein D3C81_198300 [compost metagenome]
MTVMTFKEKREFADELIDSMKVYAAMQDVSCLEFYQKEEKDKDNLYFIVEHKKTGSIADTLRDKFNQSSNGYPSMKVIFDFRSNRIYAKLKLRARIQIRKDKFFGDKEFVGSKDDIEESFEDNCLQLPTKKYDRGSWCRNVVHYYEFKYKFNGKNIEDLNKIFLVFFEMRKRGEK